MKDKSNKNNYAFEVLSKISLDVTSEIELAEIAQNHALIDALLMIKVSIDRQKRTFMEAE